MNRGTDELTFFTIMLLGILDIFNTIVILNTGGVEVNPFMDYLIQIDLILFILVKLGITLLGCLVLFKYKPNLLKYVVYLYVTVIVYEFVIMTLWSSI